MTVETAAPVDSRGNGSLLLAARAGERPAWDELVGRLTPLLWAAARGAGLPRDAAAEVVQLTWLRCLERLDGPGHGGESDRVASWLLDLCRRESHAALRRLPGTVAAVV
jgi:DNA-directed RNA polymerase specialized sigma24 family protein